MQRYDVIIIGAGLNGLVAAAYLARAGRTVLVLERSSNLGGAAMNCHPAPGFTASRYTHHHAPISGQIVRDLDLQRHGLHMLHPAPGVSIPKAGTYIASYRDPLVQHRELARHNRRDADAWHRFRADMTRAAQELRAKLEAAPADPFPGRIPGLAAARALLSWVARSAVEESAPMHDRVRLWTLSMSDFLDLYFEDDGIKAHMAGAALLANALGPKTPGSASLLPHHWLAQSRTAHGQPPGAPERIVARGGSGAMCSAVAQAATQAGATVRTDVEVTDVTLVSGRAKGVVLADGEEIEAHHIVSDLDVKRTYLSLFQSKDLPADFLTGVRRVHTQGHCATITLTLNGRPHFPAIPQDCPAIEGGIRLFGSLWEMDRAYEQWRQGEVPDALPIDLTIPTLTDPSLAPAGRHIMSIMVQYLPLERGGDAWSGEQRAALVEKVLSTVAGHCPNLPDLIATCDLVTPGDVENELGITHGDLSMGDLTLDQSLFSRPVPGYAGTASPVRNFTLSSPSTHPGPSLGGVGGANAAQAVLASLKGVSS